jgi:hypothetical protein
MMEIVLNILKESLMITSFVIIMMLLIEYFNIKTKGSWLKKLKTSGTRQVLLGASLGLLPGCLGGYAVVSLYTHHVVGFGSLLAAFIATIGDETFVMLSVMPVTALYIMGGLFAGSIIIGLIVNKIYTYRGTINTGHFEIHEHDHCAIDTGKISGIIQNLRNPSFQRGLLIFGLLVFIVFMITGLFGHEHVHATEHVHSAGETCNEEHGQFQYFLIEEWMQYSFILLAAISLFIIIKVPEHFLNEHLWNHIIKKHFLRVLMWIIVSIAAIQGLLHILHVDHLLSESMYFWSFVMLAALIGIIPQSGPHIIFISLFTQGIIPLSVLLVNSIVQEGHAGLPLLAESKKSFFLIKAVKIFIALLIAVAGFYFNF